MARLLGSHFMHERGWEAASVGAMCLTPPLRTYTRVCLIIVSMKHGSDVSSVTSIFVVDRYLCRSVECCVRAWCCSQSRPMRLGPLPSITSKGKLFCWPWYETFTSVRPFTSSSPVYVFNFLFVVVRVGPCSFRHALP